MMNSTELIIGHFEGTLTPAEAARLDELLDSSPDVRTAFERQRAIEEEMVEDSESLVPPVGLREATLAAALGGALTTTVGGGIAAWLGTKAAAVLGTLALGGLVVGGIIISSDDDPPEALTPTTQIEQTQAEGLTQEPIVGEDQGLSLSPESEGDQTSPARVGATSTNSNARVGGDNGGNSATRESHSGGAQTDNGSSHAGSSSEITLGDEDAADMGTNTTVSPSDSTEKK